jgi:hypothetical protein
MLTEYRRDRNVAGVAPSSDQAPANAAAVMPRVEGVPMSAQIGFEPGAKIHRTGYRRDANVTEIARGVSVPEYLGSGTR